MIRLISGGARSGKSTFGEEIFKGRNDITYIATAKCNDSEFEERIKKHRARRNCKWTTKECYKDLDRVVSLNSGYFLDCISNMIANITYDITAGREIDRNDEDIIYNAVIVELEKFISIIRKENKDLIIITNEVGSGIVPLEKLSRVFRDVQGRVNNYLAEQVDSVSFMVCGLEIKIK